MAEPRRERRGSLPELPPEFVDHLWDFLRRKASGFCAVESRHFVLEGCKHRSPCCLAVLPEPGQPGMLLLANPCSPLMVDLLSMVKAKQEDAASDLLQMMLSTSTWPPEFCPGRIATPQGQQPLLAPMYQHNGWSLEVPGPHRLMLPARQRVPPIPVGSASREFNLVRQSFLHVCEQRDSAIAAERGLLLETRAAGSREQALGDGLLLWSPAFVQSVLCRPLLECVFGGLGASGSAVPGKTDWLWLLSLFFSVPLVDRTGLLPTRLRLTVLDLLPSKTVVSRVAASGASLRDLVDARGRKLRATAAEKSQQIEVYWSGGIDSTALLVSLLRAGGPPLVVRYHESSVEEYPRFFDYLKSIPESVSLEYFSAEDAAAAHPSTAGGTRATNLREHIGSNPGRLSVTGELGDQLFGSHLLRRAFYPQPDEQKEKEDPWRWIRQLGLGAPWQDVLLPMLQERKLLPPQLADRTSGLEALQPWLDAAPFPIKSMFDFLWWTNMSLKWQHVALRVLNGQATVDSAVYHQRIAHFYQTEELQAWSMIPSNHAQKMPDLRVWTSYKQPLKEYIFGFTADDTYRRTKEKEGSFRHDAVSARNVALDSSFNVIGWGLHSLSRRQLRARYGDALMRFIKDVEAFDGHPEFFDEDERHERVSNPISRCTMELKCASLMPPALIRGRSVLDLGACLGAMGQWALFHGASSYTAVEVQPDFVRRSQRYLEHWGSRAKCEQADTRTFLASCPDGAFDIVVCAGLLHCFLEPLSVAVELQRVAARAVVVESIHPGCVRFGNVFDQIPVTQVYSDAPVNVQRSFKSLVGLSAMPSMSSLKLLFALGGFEAEEVDVPPSQNPFLAIYAAVLPGAVKPVRFFVRFVRSVSGLKLKSLEDGLLHMSALSDNGEASQATFESWEQVGDKFGIWKEPTQLAVATAAAPAVDGVDAAAAVGALRAGGSDDKEQVAQPWEFDDAIAARFEEEARQNIPGYDHVVSLSTDVACCVVPQHRRSADARVIDVGCAIGYTLKALLQKGFKRVVGVDSSSAMLRRCRAELASHGTGGQVALVESAEFPHHLGPFDVALANWTLHFVRRRGDYLQTIFDGLAPGGLLVLTEKTVQGPLVQDMYHQWKLGQGMTQEEVDRKAQRLVGVLEPFPVQWYMNTLRGIGFVEVDVLHALYGFVTLQARKPAGGKGQGKGGKAAAAFGNGAVGSATPEWVAAATRRAEELGFLLNEAVWSLSMNTADAASKDTRSWGDEDTGGHGGRVSHAVLSALEAQGSALPAPSAEEVETLELLPEGHCIPSLYAGHWSQGHLFLSREVIAKLELAAGPEKPLPSVGSYLLSYSPVLVYILRNRARTAYCSGNDVDRTFAIGRMLGYPVIDRTGVLPNGLRCKVLHPIPAFDPKFSKSLEDLMLGRARALLDTCAARLHLCWSGGIDSTAMLVAFQRVATPTEWAERVTIVYNPSSKKENPRFFESVVATAPSTEEFGGHIRDLADGSRCVVLADPADMLFGTVFLSSAFRDDFIAAQPGGTAAATARQAGRVSMPNRLRAAGLDAPWEQVVPAMLRDRELLAPGWEAEQKWRRWIAPFLDKSPVPVQNVFDFFWWVTYALKWQHDVMRMFYNRSAVDANLVDSVKNFFITEDFQQWSFHHHKEKMQDFRVWASYKWPLKEFILQHTGDREYYAGKIKVPSSAHWWGYQVGLDDSLQIVQWGRLCASRRRMREKYGDRLYRFLEQHPSEFAGYDSGDGGDDCHSDTTLSEPPTLEDLRCIL